MNEDVKQLLKRIDHLCGKIDALIDLMTLREERDQAAMLAQLHADDEHRNGNGRE